jgi:membrane-associated phospholipid phosphatase
MTERERTAPRPATKLALAGVMLLGTVATAVAGASNVGVRVDRALLDALAVHRYATLWNYTFRLNSDLPTVIAVLGALACLAGLVRRGPNHAAAVPVCIAVAVGIAEALKCLGVVAPTQGLLGVSGPSWPSSHAAAIGALGGAVMLIPRGPLSRRAVSGIVLVMGSLGCVSLVITRSHRPTDIVGGALIGGCVCSLVAFVLDHLAAEVVPRWRRGPRARRDA